jgi:hypothetical protein
VITDSSYVFGEKTPGLLCLYLRDSLGAGDLRVLVDVESGILTVSGASLEENVVVGLSDTFRPEHCRVHISEIV